MLTMTEAKKLAKTNIQDAVGQEFACEFLWPEDKKGQPTGAIGVILGAVDLPGGGQKVQAELTCTVEGCTEKHVRLASDWHQSTKCETHAKTKVKRTGSVSIPGTGGGRQVKMPDGSIFREMKVSENDSADIKEAKAQSNELFETLYAQEQARKEAEKVQAAEARKAKQEADRIAREAKQSEEKKAAILAAKDRALAYVQKNGGQVSPKLLAEAAAAE